MLFEGPKGSFRSRKCLKFKKGVGIVTSKQQLISTLSFPFFSLLTPFSLRMLSFFFAHVECVGAKVLRNLFVLVFKIRIDYFL